LTACYGWAAAKNEWHQKLATQFHPEKSQKVALQLLKNFVDLAKG
jgi:imidazoleglycerol phosphate synthase glutamine amidotransferase subunit HisH